MVPDSIVFANVILGDRGREQYDEIEELADSIEEVGLIEPIILNPDYTLNAGGRRYKALELLKTEVLYHATSCEPGRPGFIFRGEANPFERLLTEIQENKYRKDFTWVEEMNLLCKAWRIGQIHALRERNELLLMRDFGHTLGVSYAKLQSAVAIQTDFKERPELYSSCTSIRAAYAVHLKNNAKHIERQLAEKLLKEREVMKPTGPTSNSTNNAESATGLDEVTRPTIQFSKHFQLASGLNYLTNASENQFDHIVADPDYGLSKETVAQGQGTNEANMQSGVYHKTVEESLADVKLFLELAFRPTKHYLIFFYDLDHHEKLSAWATTAGWRVQRWPIIWHKLGYRSNASPHTNFCKNIEYAMVCAKPGSTLAKTQMSSVFVCDCNVAPKEFGHPFAKPEPLWHFIYQAVAIQGQTVFDPFMGSGSAPAAARTFGLIPYGTEIVEDHFNRAVINLKRTYTKLIGECDFV